MNIKIATWDINTPRIVELDESVKIANPAVEMFVMNTAKGIKLTGFGFFAQTPEVEMDLVACPK